VQTTGLGGYATFAVRARASGPRYRIARHRRLAAILAADVVGYSRLMEADEAGTARMLRDHRAAADPLVAEHGGRIVKTIACAICRASRQPTGH